jgi:hypothetical protein
MSFAYQRVAWQALVAKDFSTDYAMGDIRPVAVTTQFRGIGKEHADIMQEGRLLDEDPVNRCALFDQINNPHSQPGNQVAVGKQEAFCFVVTRVILIY